MISLGYSMIGESSREIKEINLKSIVIHADFKLFI